MERQVNWQDNAQKLVDLAIGYTNFVKVKEVTWYGDTLSISCEPHDSYVGDKGMMQVYYLLRFLHTEKERKVFMIDPVMVHVNILDNFPDKAEHHGCQFSNQFGIISLLKEMGVEFCDKVRSLDYNECFWLKRK